MGPRPFGRGRPWAARHAWFEPAMLQWGRDLSAAEGCRGAPPRALRSSFNGAATFRPRKAYFNAYGALHLELLQWGRDLSAAEGLRPARGSARFQWLQWGRDLSAAEGRLSCKGCCTDGS